MVMVSHPLTHPGALGALSRSGAKVAALRAVYRNAPITTGAITSAACLGTFDVLQRSLKRGQGGEVVSPLEIAEAGLVAGGLSALLGHTREFAAVSRAAISTGLFFGISNLTRTRFFSPEDAVSVPALVAGGAVGGVISEAARLSMEGFSRSSLAGQVMRSLPGTFSFVLTASAIQKSLAL